MKYGATFKADIYLYDEEKGETLVTRASDYLKTQLWAPDNTAKMADAAEGMYNNYALVYFALRREGRLSEYGIAADKLTIDVLDGMTERMSVFVSSFKDDELPLKAQTK